MKLIFLGTGGSMPTPERGLSSVALKHNGELILFDCGEGTQRQMAQARVSSMKLKSVFLTHFHGDHFLGLAGLVQTMSLMKRKETLKIYGPAGTKDLIKIYLRVPLYTRTFDVEIHELRAGESIKEKGYQIKTAPIKHTVPGLAYSFVEDPRPGRFNLRKALALGLKPGPDFSRLQSNQKVKLPDGRTIAPRDVLGPQRPGRKVVYANDTRPSQSVVKLAMGADVLIHDCTLDERLVKRAKESGHSTPAEAARVAKKAKVKMLVLTHISPRYRDDEVLLKQARKIFPNTVVAKDLMELEVPFQEP